MSHFIDIEANRKALQAALIAAGFTCGPAGADGVLGPETAKAIIAYRNSRIPPLAPIAGVVEEKLLAALGLNQPTETKPMFPTILQMIIGFLPGIPDDIALVEAEIKEIASTDSGTVKLQAALTFAKNIIVIVEKVLGIPPTV